MSRTGKHKLFKTISITTGCLIGVPVIIVLCLLIALRIPSVQQKAATVAARILSEKIGIEATVGHFSVKPPFDVLLKDIYAGNSPGDTIFFVGSLDARLRVDALPDSIAVRLLEIDNLTAHSGNLLPYVRIDGKVGRLSTGMKAFEIDEPYFRMTDVRIKDADISIQLNDEKDDDTDESSSSGTKLAFDLDGFSLENVRFLLQPYELKLGLGRAEGSALVDLGKSCYTVRDIDISDADFNLRNLNIPVSDFSGNAIVDIGNSLISSDNLVISSPGLQTDANFHNFRLDLESMRLNAIADGNIAGAGFTLDADYGIDDEAFSADIVLNRTDLAKLLQMPDDELVVAGHIKASGAGINPKDRKMTADIAANLDSCRFNSVDISGVNLSARLHSRSIDGSISAPVHYSDTSLSAGMMLDSRFAISDFPGKSPGVTIDANLSSIDVSVPTDTLAISNAHIDFKTGKELCDIGISMPGLALSANMPAHILDIPSLLPSLPDTVSTLAELDSLMAGIPEIKANLKIQKGNPVQALLKKRGFDLTELNASLQPGGGTSRILDISLKTPDLNGKYRLPAINAFLSADLSQSKTSATLQLNADVTDGLMSVKGIDSGIDLHTTLSRNGEDLKIDGDLKLAGLNYDGKNIGDRNILFNLRPETDNPNHLTAYADLDEIPIELFKQFVTIPEEIGIQGRIKARATVKGIPDNISIFAGIKPIDVAMEYVPYDATFRLGDQELTLEDSRINMNGLSLFGADSTVVALEGGVDLNSMLVDIQMKSGGFEPVRLPEGGPLIIYGKLLSGIDGRIHGPLDSLLTDIDFTILPETDITYPIDNKNLVQLSPSGTMKVEYNSSTGLRLGGQLDVAKGKLFYSPKLYPMMPFTIDKGSHVKFNGDIEDTELAISASQDAKATYKPQGEVSRKVDFITGVKVGGTLKKLDIGFFLDAPKDKDIQKELAETAEEDREGLAAVLLATGMYASDSNEAVQMEGYALSSIVQSKLNAATSNSLGNAIDLDFGVSKAKHGRGIETTDYTLNVSKSFFEGKLNVKLGGSVSDNAEVNKNSTSFINNLSAEYRLDSVGRYKARLFSIKDYNNIVEGELIKSGLGILIDKTLRPQLDSLDRSLDIEFEGNAVQRSNNQFGPDAAVALIKQNIFSRGDIFTARVKGAYYWNLNRRQFKDPARNDTYLLGADFSLSFPYMQLGRWTRKYYGQTLYRLGYMNENISGDYGIHKLYGGTDYSIRKNEYITHSFSPFYLSIVLADNASEDLSKDIGFVDLLKLYIDNEFITSAGYSFSYNDYRDKNRDINTALDIQLKESGNLLSGILAASGRDFNERFKQFLGIQYDQFVKFKLELRNKFKLDDKLELATRAIMGAVISYGNSVASPLSESFSIGGPNSIRAFSPRSIGPGDFHNQNYSSYIFHSGDIKLEMNAELRFPIIWKFNGALFVDAGNVWNQRDPREYLSAEQIEAYLKGFNLPHMYNSRLQADTFLRQIALGSGMGLRLDYESIVIRLDLGVAIHAPFDTGRQGYYNIPNFWRDGLRLNFGIGYPF